MPDFAARWSLLLGWFEACGSASTRVCGENTINRKRGWEGVKKKKKHLPEQFGFFFFFFLLYLLICLNKWYWLIWDAGSSICPSVFWRWMGGSGLKVAMSAPNLGSGKPAVQWKGRQCLSLAIKWRAHLALRHKQGWKGLREGEFSCPVASTSPQSSREVTMAFTSSAGVSTYIYNKG